MYSVLFVRPEGVCVYSIPGTIHSSEFNIQYQHLNILSIGPTVISEHISGIIGQSSIHMQTLTIPSAQ